MQFYLGLFHAFKGLACFLYRYLLDSLLMKLSRNLSFPIINKEFYVVLKLNEATFFCKYTSNAIYKRKKINKSGKKI